MSVIIVGAAILLVKAVRQKKMRQWREESVARSRYSRGDGPTGGGSGGAEGARSGGENYIFGAMGNNGIDLGRVEGRMLEWKGNPDERALVLVLLRVYNQAVSLDRQRQNAPRHGADDPPWLCYCVGEALGVRWGGSGPVASSAHLPPQLPGGSALAVCSWFLVYLFCVLQLEGARV